MSKARGYNPHFDQGFVALQYICDKHADNLEFIKYDCRELVDEYGEVYQVAPVISISFKG